MKGTAETVPVSQPYRPVRQGKGTMSGFRPQCCPARVSERKRPAVDIMSLVNRFARYLTMGALFLSLLLPAGLGQEPQEQDQPEFKIGVAVDQVFLSVTARARDGGFYKNLTREDFRVLEDGVEQHIINFTQEAVPVSVVLLIDASGSTRFTQASIRSAALRFAESLSQEDKVAIITFNDAPRLILEWTNDLEKVRYALETIYAKGPTVMNDALFVTFDDLLKNVEGKTAVMMLTDGVDTGSMVGMEEATDLATRSDAIVYTASKLDEYWAGAIRLPPGNPGPWSTRPQPADGLLYSGGTQRTSASCQFNGRSCSGGPGLQQSDRGLRDGSRRAQEPVLPVLHSDQFAKRWWLAQARGDTPATRCRHQDQERLPCPSR